MVPATRPAVGGTIRLFVTSKWGMSPCHARLHIDVIILWLGGGYTKSRRAKAGDTDKQADTGCFTAWGGGISVLCVAGGGVWGGNPPR
jgi:hypothetical protein